MNTHQSDSAGRVEYKHRRSLGLTGVSLELMSSRSIVGGCVSTISRLSSQKALTIKDQQPSRLTPMNRCNTPKSKQDAKPHPQLSLTHPSTMATLLVPEKKQRVKHVSKPHALTSKRSETRSTKRNH
ncbi:hypothetical protein F2Q68_00016620 [Brassica cretica]|uniref:Uncharacterized protein n=1 Tax=Brassica cretica TaxID=69181 RepID=A0A8S9HMK0_BRACR|nr:hypothetical protein F2Q68_00016620 [Brassica cretica]